METIEYRHDKNLPIAQVINLYTSLDWAAARKPQALEKALQNSGEVVSAWDGERLVGLGNAISDGYLVVYYPHLAVHPDYQRRGIGRQIVRRLRKRYEGFHQQQVVADGGAIEFFRKCGFSPSGACQALWIYDGSDHD